MDKDRTLGFRCAKVQFCVECNNTVLFFKMCISFNFMKFFIIQNSVIRKKKIVRFYFIFYNNLEIDFQNYLVTLHSIEVIVQDTKIIDGLSSAITEKTEL